MAHSHLAFFLSLATAYAGRQTRFRSPCGTSGGGLAKWWSDTNLRTCIQKRAFAFQVWLGRGATPRSSVNIQRGFGLGKERRTGASRCCCRGLVGVEADGGPRGLEQQMTGDSDEFIDDTHHPLGALHVAVSASGQSHAHGGAAAAALHEAISLSRRNRPDTMARQWVEGRVSEHGKRGRSCCYGRRMERVWPERAERLRSRGRTCMRRLGCMALRAPPRGSHRKRAAGAPAATSNPRLRPFGCQQVSGRAPRKRFELLNLGKGLW
jgi:hypothetical protein